MGDTLFGGERSGTPIETRKGSAGFASLLQQLMAGGGEKGLKNITDPFTRLISDALMASFGGANSEKVIRDLLADPRDRTRGLFASIAPFEAEETERQASGVRGIFGTMGGRFSRNVGEAEATTRSKVAGEFGRNREQAILQAEGLRAGVLQGLMQAGLQRAQLAMTPLQIMAQFLQPGAPVQSDGILPGLLSGGINIYGIQKLLGNKSPAAGIPNTGRLPAGRQVPTYGSMNS